MPSCATGIFH